MKNRLLTVKILNLKMKSKINELLEEVNRMAAANADELEALRIKYLSKK